MIELAKTTSDGGIQAQNEEGVVEGRRGHGGNQNILNEGEGGGRMVQTEPEHWRTQQAGKPREVFADYRCRRGSKETGVLS